MCVCVYVWKGGNVARAPEAIRDVILRGGFLLFVDYNVRLEIEQSDGKERSTTVVIVVVVVAVGLVVSVMDVNWHDAAAFCRMTIKRSKRFVARLLYTQRPMMLFSLSG